MALPADWTYQLGQAFLTAALSCGAVCERAFVADGCAPEGMPPGCCCQLAVVVTEGWDPLPKCGARRVAEIRLVLMLPTLLVGSEAVPEPAEINTQAQANASIRWQIQAGLRQAWRTGALSACGEDLGPLAATLCGRIRPGMWRCVAQGGGVARWEALWRFEEDQ